MRTSGILVIAVLAAFGCKKESATSGAAAGGATGGQPIAAASTDPLWAFAPADMTVGVVVADGVLEPLYTGGLKALAALEKAPGGAEIAATIRQQARSPVGDVLDRATLDGLGIDLGKGMAFFEAPAAKVAVLPVADMSKFAGKLAAPVEGGVLKMGPMSCKQASGRLLCADSQPALDAASKGGAASPVAGWPREMRGHAEVFVAAARMGADIPLTEPGGLRASAVFEKGGMSGRFHLIGKPAGPLAAAKGGRSSLVAGVAELQPTGLIAVSAAGLWKLALAQAAGKPGEPLPGGVDSMQLLTAMSGEAVGYALPGLPLRAIGKIGLTSAEPVKKLLGACDQFAAKAPPGVAIKKNGERCTVTVDPAALGAQVSGMAPFSVDLWVDGGALVVGLGQHQAKSDARPGLAPFAAQVLDGSWLFAAWGRGTLAGGPLLADKAQLDAMRAGDPTGGLAVWAVHHLNEFGLAGRVGDDGIHGLVYVRTLWSNPDQLATELQAKIGEFVRGQDGALGEMAALAAKYPDSPFARDVQAGAGGLMAPVALAGVVAAISIPAFIKYQRRSAEIREMEAPAPPPPPEVPAPEPPAPPPPK